MQIEPATLLLTEAPFPTLMKMRFLCEAVLAIMLSTAIASAQQLSDTVAAEAGRWRDRQGR